MPRKGKGNDKIGNFEKKYGVPRLTKLHSRTRVTINDLLTSDDVNGILADLDKVKPHIKAAIVIYIDKRDDKYHWGITDDTLVSTAVWMLESTKMDLLCDDED